MEAKQSMTHATPFKMCFNACEIGANADKMITKD